MQTTLFDDWELKHEAADPLSLLSAADWSHSRRGVFEQCPRRYYYEYFGAHLRKANEEPLKDLLRRLKALQNRHERTGGILHFVIATYFRKAQAGESWDASRLANWACDIFRGDVTYSKEDPRGLNPREGKFPPVLLMEFHDENQLAEKYCEEAEERMARALSHFATLPVYEDFRLAGASKAAHVEKHFKKLDAIPCGVDGVVDLAFERDGATTIVDWKSGEAENQGDESLQLDVYTLWATEELGASPEGVRRFKAFLGSGELTEYPLKPGNLRTARARIMQDAERMKAMDDYGERGIADAFTPCAYPNVCRLCAFKCACEEGKRCLS